MMHYTMEDHIMRYHMGRRARTLLAYAWGDRAFPSRPMRREDRMEGPLCACGHHTHITLNCPTPCA